MRIVKSLDGVEYGMPEAVETGAMARLLAKAFSRFEPMGVAVDLPFVQIERLVAAFVPKALAEQLSVVARDASTGHLLGALLADDFGTDPPPGLEEAAPRFAPIGALLEGLDEQYRAKTAVAPGTHAHLFMVAVAEAATSRGIAGRLVQTCIDNAKQLGYTTAITEATGSASQRVFRKLGFVDALVTPYKDFTFDGVRVFSSIDGVEGTILMTRNLG